MAKPFAGLLLLLGTLGAELVLFGYEWAGAVAVGMWVACATVLVATREPQVVPERRAAPRTSARSAHVLG